MIHWKPPVFNIYYPFSPDRFAARVTNGKVESGAFALMLSAGCLCFTCVVLVFRLKGQHFQAISLDIARSELEYQ